MSGFIRPIIRAAIPYAAVAAGLFFARSAWTAILLYHAGIVVLLAADRPRERIGETGRGLCVVAAAAGVVVGGCAGILLWSLWPYINSTTDGLGAVLSRFGLSGASWAVFAVYYATVHPFLEELHWRVDAPAGSVPSWWDAGFAGYHVLVLHYFITPLWIGVAFVVLLLTSWLWRLAARRFGGLAVPLLSHAAADASIVLAASFIL
jgi:hypothetical protein